MHLLESSKVVSNILEPPPLPHRNANFEHQSKVYGAEERGPALPVLQTTPSLNIAHI